MEQEWRIIQPLLPPVGARGGRPGVALREGRNVVRYLAQVVCGWRILPGHGRPSTGGSGGSCGDSAQRRANARPLADGA
jgi:transposase